MNSPDTGDKKLHNVVVTPPGSGANCPTGSTDPDCVANVPGPQLHVVKTSSGTAARQGQTVRYTIVATNTGQAAFTTAKPASFTDDLTKVLDDASYNGDADNGATYTAPTLSWSGPLSVGASVTITYTVTAHNPDTGDKFLDNTVTTPPGVDGNCTTGSTDPDCATRTPVGAYVVKKTSSANKVKPGDTIHYTIVVTNTGEVAYTTATPASFVDDITEVLDDATYNDDATGAATYAAPKLSWSGALPVAGLITITYSLTVKNPDTGDAKLHNVVTTPSDHNGVSAANCPGGTSDQDCQTNGSVEAAATTPPTPTLAPPMAFTGSDSQLELIVAGLLLGAGALLMLTARRRRSQS